MCKILVIEGEKNIRFLLAEYLRGTKNEVVVTNDGNDGLHQLQAEKFDVMFLDLTLSDVDVLDFLRRSKALSPALDIVMMSTFSTKEMLKDAAALGVTHFLEKPFTTEEVHRILHDVLHKSEKGVTSVSLNL